jgi:hypothetical protein
MDNDFPLMRFADVVYMRAEAILRGASGSIDWNLLGLMRLRANATPYTGVGTGGTLLDLDELLRERGREFAWELVRRRDLIRFGKYSYQDPAHWASNWRQPAVTVNPRNQWFPIPRAVLETSAGVWTQNPGY